MNSAERAALIQPFYLKMMRYNAAEYGTVLLPELVAAARTLALDDVIALLRPAWREQVMGAWFSLGFDDATVTAEVLDALARSHGSLDAPPLAVAAVVLAGDAALPALTTYATRDVTAGWEACGFVAAAVGHLGETCKVCAPKNEDRSSFDTLLSFARRLRTAFLGD